MKCQMTMKLWGIECERWHFSLTKGHMMATCCKTNQSMARKWRLSKTSFEMNNLKWNEEMNFWSFFSLNQLMIYREEEKGIKHWFASQQFQECDARYVNTMLCTHRVLAQICFPILSSQRIVLNGLKGSGEWRRATNEVLRQCCRV